MYLKGESISNSKMTIVKQLIDRGKKSGLLTYKEIMDTLEDVDLSPEVNRNPIVQRIRAAVTIFGKI